MSICGVAHTNVCHLQAAHKTVAGEVTSRAAERVQIFSAEEKISSADSDVADQVQAAVSSAKAALEPTIKNEKVCLSTL